MPEGPSMVILKDAVQEFKGKKVVEVEGNSTIINKDLLLNRKIIEFKTWGKHFLICFNDFTIRVHFLLFGTYRINESKDTPARLHLGFKKGELNFYACSVRIIEEDLDEVYDWTADVMNDAWNPAGAKKKLLSIPGMVCCDALLNQDIFAGVGNIIKNEVLFRIGVHPLSLVESLPKTKLTALIREARIYSFQFLEWKKAFVLKKHWLVHGQRECPNGHGPLTIKYLGKTKRKSYYCERCQPRYGILENEQALVFNKKPDSSERKPVIGKQPTTSKSRLKK
ncbi:MAG TPA: DNA-formamidopyrimidine glycosylase family protein [Flavitalea sp.]|nr:DNA-formamidopyrimidine glycosylase family protein [Flavitalea sp.]